MTHPFSEFCLLGIIEPTAVTTSLWSLTHEVTYFEKFGRTSMEYLESAWDLTSFNQTPLQVTFQLSEICWVFVVQECPDLCAAGFSRFFVVHLCSPFFSSKMKLIWHIYINVFECLFTRYSGTSIRLRWRMHFRKTNGWNLKILFQGAFSFSGEPFCF